MFRVALKVQDSFLSHPQTIITIPPFHPLGFSRHSRLVIPPSTLIFIQSGGGMVGIDYLWCRCRIMKETTRWNCLPTLLLSPARQKAVKSCRHISVTLFTGQWASPKPPRTLIYSIPQTSIQRTGTNLQQDGRAAQRFITDVRCGWPLILYICISCNGISRILL